MHDENAPYLDPIIIKELEVNIAAMEIMRYDAVAIGLAELRYSYRFFKEKINRSSFPVVNCNIYTADEPVAVPVVIKRFGRVRAAIVGVWEYEEPYEYLSYFEDAVHGLTITDPIEAVARVLSQINSHQYFIIVVGSISPATARRLIRRCPNIGLIITSARYYIDYEGIPQYGDTNLSLQIYREDKSGFYKNTLILYANMDSYGISCVDFRLGHRGRIRDVCLYRIILSENIPEHMLVRGLLDRYYNSMESVQVKPLFLWDPLLKGNAYVGANTCHQCHQTEYEHWKLTKHAFAYKTLIIRHRQLYPRCVVCHVTAYGYNPGFKIGENESIYGGVQCEVCHGPGKNHVRAPAPQNIRRLPPQKVCLECHTPTHSNEFIYSQRISQVRHYRSNTQGEK